MNLGIFKSVIDGLAKVVSFVGTVTGNIQIIVAGKLVDGLVKSDLDDTKYLDCLKDNEVIKLGEATAKVISERKKE